MGPPDLSDESLQSRCCLEATAVELLSEMESRV